jgi:hypothetical protein
LPHDLLAGWRSEKKGLFSNISELIESIADFISALRKGRPDVDLLHHCQDRGINAGGVSNAKRIVPSGPFSEIGGNSCA